MALSQVEDYADELNELAGQVRRNLELIGRLDEVIWQLRACLSLATVASCRLLTASLTC